MIGGRSVLLGMPRRWGVPAGVVLVHLAVLWWLQHGLSRELLPLITPVTLISVPLDPPAAVVPVPTPLSGPLPAPVRAAPTSRQPAPTEKPAQPAAPPAAVNLAPAPSSLPNVPVTSAPATDAHAQTVTASPAGARAGAAAGGATAAPLVLPSASAAYLHNPPPAYPAMSRRLAEQGRVMVRVLIGTDGLPQKAELQSGSGYDRLDRAALEAVMRWRFVPGRRGDVPETMWVSVPIVFSLE